MPIAPGLDHEFLSTKTYGHEQGFSCCYRQWRAKSHCRFLHGYALKVHLEFSCIERDENGWVQDYGDLKEVKTWLQFHFDHKTLVAADDPQISIFREMQIAGMCELVILKDGVGTEAFARMIYEKVREMTYQQSGDRVRLDLVRVHEHDGNASSYGKRKVLSHDQIVHLVDARLQARERNHAGRT